LFCVKYIFQLSGQTFEHLNDASLKVPTFFSLPLSKSVEIFYICKDSSKIFTALGDGMTEELFGQR